MKVIRIILPLLLIGLFSCGEDTSPRDQDCPKELLCTEEFVSLTFSPRENGMVIQFDSYYTQNLDNGETYNYDPNDNLPDDLSYVVISDAEMGEIAKDGTSLRFFGIKDNQVLIEQDFIVGHDCCHVIPLDGPFGGL